MHDHNHPHTHGTEAVSREELLALLKYMLNHNAHHAEELHDVCHKLEDMGKADAAEKLGQARHEYYHGNEHLAEALEALKVKE